MDGGRRRIGGVEDASESQRRGPADPFWAQGEKDGTVKNADPSKYQQLVDRAERLFLRISHGAPVKTLS